MGGKTSPSLRKLKKAVEAYSPEHATLVISGFGLLAEPDLLQFLHDGKRDQQSHVVLWGL